MTPPHPSAIAEREAIVRWLEKSRDECSANGALKRAFWATQIRRSIELGDHLKQERE